MNNTGRAMAIGFAAGIWTMIFVGMVIWHQPGPTVEQWCETKVLSRINLTTPAESVILFLSGG